MNILKYFLYFFTIFFSLNFFIEDLFISKNNIFIVQHLISFQKTNIYEGSTFYLVSNIFEFFFKCYKN
jgi:hypothetical protein